MAQRNNNGAASAAPSRRQLLTGAAAYAAGAAIVAGGTAIVSKAHGSTPAINLELTRLIDAADRAANAARDHHDAVFTPAWQRYSAAAETIPHVEVRGFSTYDGGPVVWSTSQKARVSNARHDVRKPPRFASMGAEDARAYHQAQRRLLAADLWRNRKLQQAMTATGYSAAYDEDDRLELLAEEAATRVYQYPFANAAELSAALDFAEDKGAGDAVLLPMLSAGIRRLAGEVRA
jgi:hypothetical protein